MNTASAYRRSTLGRVSEASETRSENRTSDVTAHEDWGGARENSTQYEYEVDRTVQHVEENSKTKYVVGGYSCTAKCDALEPENLLLRQTIDRS